MKGLHLRGRGAKGCMQMAHLLSYIIMCCVCITPFLHSDISITSSSEEISTKDKKDIPTVIITHGVNKPTPHGSLEMAHEQSTITKENNSWDRYVCRKYPIYIHTDDILYKISDDSIEELDPPHNGRTSSTPIKVSVGTYLQL